MTMQANELKIERYDLSDDKSLRAWSAADEYLLQKFNELKKCPNHLSIYNDRFGYLACHLQTFKPTVVIANKSQEKAIQSNLKDNKITDLNFSNPLADFEKESDLAILKIPKSLGLFKLYLKQIAHNSSEDVIVICAFMTRHFTPKILQIAQVFFEVTEQSKAKKKARLLVLSKKKPTIETELIVSQYFKGEEYKQYLGVFSAEHIDYATQFFLENLEINSAQKNVLDLASGNGIIGHQISQQLPDANIHLMDDSFLAVASAELNVSGPNIHHYYNNDLTIFNDNNFDLIVTNPPFHFEYEINIQIPIRLFKECFRCLKAGGNLQIVASKHLNYLVHLNRIFTSVEIIAEDKKFIVYKCTK